MYSQNLLFFIPYFVSWYQSCRFLRLGYHFGIHRHFSSLHSWICFLFMCFLQTYWNLFNSEEMKKLRSLLGSLNKPTGTCSLALSGTPSLSFYINASHRVYDSKSQLFHTYTPSPSNKKIAMANGSLATVASFGDIYITPTLILKNVLPCTKKYWPTLFPFKNLPMILNVMLFFSLLIVFFRNKARGGRLDLLRKGEVFTTLNHLRKLVIICRCLFSIPQIKIPFGCITYI